MAMFFGSSSSKSGNASTPSPVAVYVPTFFFGNNIFRMEDVQTGRFVLVSDTHGTGSPIEYKGALGWALRNKIFQRDSGITTSFSKGGSYSSVRSDTAYFNPDENVLIHMFNVDDFTSGNFDNLFTDLTFFEMENAHLIEVKGYSAHIALIRKHLEIYQKDYKARVERHQVAKVALM